MSRKIRVLLCKNFFEKDLEYIRSRLAENVEVVRPAAFTQEVIAEAVKDNIHVLLGEPPGKMVLDNGKDLELIQIPWTGVDRLDFELLKQYSFLVCNSHSNAKVVAEYAVAMMLAVAKWLPLHDRYLRKGKWCRPQQDTESFFLPPEPIYGKTVLIVGYGAVGQYIAKLLTGFSVELQAVDAKEHAIPPEPLSKIVQPRHMLDIAAEADFLFVAVPLTNKTRGMINKSILDMMKPMAYFINTSRGEVVEEEDVYNALKNKKIAGAAIDTWYNYPKPGKPDVFPSQKFPFHELDNLVLSPHRAGFAREMLPHLDDAIGNLNRLATGQKLINVVNLQEGY
jgi:phosphoglycerate dehydrogenase-like enzyme